jgi:hypothetical protein
MAVIELYHSCVLAGGRGGEKPCSCWSGKQKRRELGRLDADERIIWKHSIRKRGGGGENADWIQLIQDRCLRWGL